MARPDPPLTRTMHAWLLASGSVTLAPHLFFQPLWISAVAVLIVLWAGLRIRRDAGTALARSVLVLLGLTAGVVILASFGTVFGKRAGVALLTLLLSLKLLESRTRRDAHVFILLCYFLQLALFLDTQSALTALGATLGTLLTTAALSSLHAPTAVRAQLRLAGGLLLQAIPLMLVMFIVFPRIPGPLWGLPSDAFSAMTGLSDSMSPGTISDLSQSAEIAFRAKFDGTAPENAQRYWRGPVLTDFDGQRWRAARMPMLEAPAYQPLGPQLRYTLTLEPHNRPWLLALDYPGAGIENARYTPDYQVLSAQPVRQRLRYDATAYPRAIVGADAPRRTLDEALHLPHASNPRTRALAETLRARHRTPEAIVDATVAWMREANLVYTLRPPLLGQHSADDFLFGTRQGFCEHFASSFAILMRAAGVPARIVTGYQGGERNPFDDSLVVRQSDAHAWTEVWLAGQGWVRIDPTAASFPRRIDGGMAAALPAGEPVPFMVATDMQWLRGMRDRLDFLANSWNQWVLGYDQNSQRELFSRVGLKDVDWRDLGALLLVGLGIVLAALLWWSHRRGRTTDPLRRHWRHFERKLARAGTPRLPWEGPADYAKRAARAHPPQGSEIITIARAYAIARYGRGAGSPADVHDFKHRIDRLRITCQ